MTISASARHHLFRKLEDVLGPEDATTLMDSLPPGGWENVATKDDVHGATVLLRSEMATMAAELRAEMATLAGELRAEMGTLGGGLRSEIANLGGQLRAEMAANQRSTMLWVTAMNATMLGAVIAAIRL